MRKTNPLRADEESPGLRCATPRGVAKGAVRLERSPGILRIEVSRNVAKCQVTAQKRKTNPNMTRTSASVEWTCGKNGNRVRRLRGRGAPAPARAPTPRAPRHAAARAR